MADIERQLSTQIKDASERLVRHPLYSSLDTPARLRIFMKHHVFAVWDFFSLLKRLQNEVTCVSVPWVPRRLGDHARFITEILVAEECDEGLDSHHLSHFELYLKAMDEMRADTKPIEDYIGRIEASEDTITALTDAHLPETVKTFVSATLNVAMHGAPHKVAASFCYGRENLLPEVFTTAHDGMTAVLDQAPIFKYYLNRHIALDHEEHGPLALRLLDAMCQGDPVRLEEADNTAVEAICMREVLWDGIYSEICETT